MHLGLYYMYRRIDVFINYVFIVTGVFRDLLKFIKRSISSCAACAPPITKYLYS